MILSSQYPNMLLRQIFGALKFKKKNFYLDNSGHLNLIEPAFGFSHKVYDCVF